jgi:hypothetical protein
MHDSSNAHEILAPWGAPTCVARTARVMAYDPC